MKRSKLYRQLKPCFPFVELYQGGMNTTDIARELNVSWDVAKNRLERAAKLVVTLKKL